MRAAVFREHGKPLVVETVPDPVPEADQVILEVSHAGICGSDLHMTENPGMTPGIILGHEFAGVRGQVIVAGVILQQDSFLPIVALGKEVTIRYSQAYTERDFEAVIDAMARGEVNPGPIHTSTVSLDELPEAFEALRGSPRECKVLIRPQ